MAGRSSTAFAETALKPLPARSVVLSLMLGSHPGPMSPAALTRTAGHFDIAPSTLRAALTRAVASGDLARDDSGYRLGERLLARQHHQSEAVAAIASEWEGDWEMAVIVVSGRAGPERASLRDVLRRERLGELREGIWMRPANLRRPARYADHPALTTFRARPDQDSRTLAHTLWDLDAWATTGHLIVDRLAATRPPPQRLAVAAHLVRHLATDPILPTQLLPAPWPGPRLRDAYAEYQDELRQLDTT